jgi:hypothetical protein
MSKRLLLAFILVVACRRDDAPIAPGPTPTPATTPAPAKKNLTRIVLDREAMTTHGTDVETVEKVLAASSIKPLRDKSDDMAVGLVLDSMPDAESLMGLKIQDVGKTGQPVYLRNIARIEIILR